jgi:AMIN domain
MRRYQAFPRLACAFLLLWVLSTLHATALHGALANSKIVVKEPAAPPPAALTEVRVLYQGGLWHVVLSGSEPMTYRAIKLSDPLRLLIDLPNTANTSVKSPITVDNEAISTIKAATIVRDPQPLTRIEIGLKLDVSFRLRGVQDRVWVTLGAAAPVPPAATTLQVEPLKTMEKVKIEPPQPKRSEITLPPKSSTVPTLPFAPPPRNKQKTSATRILAIEPVSVDQGLRVYVKANGGLSRYKAFHLTNPPRLVVDLLDVQTTQTSESVAFAGSLVRKVQVGRHGDRMRLVFEIIPAAGIPYQITSGEDRLVVSFKPGPGFPPR